MQKSSSYLSVSLCDVRAEVEEKAEDLTTAIEHYRYLPVVEISITMYCKFVAKVWRDLNVSLVNMEKYFLNSRIFSVFLESSHKFEI